MIATNRNTHADFILKQINTDYGLKFKKQQLANKGELIALLYIIYIF